MIIPLLLAIISGIALWLWSLHVYERGMRQGKRQTLIRCRRQLRSHIETFGERSAFDEAIGDLEYELAGID